jgi:hypothetical protein
VKKLLLKRLILSDLSSTLPHPLGMSESPRPVPVARGGPLKLVIK